MVAVRSQAAADGGLGCSVGLRCVIVAEAWVGSGVERGAAEVGSMVAENYYCSWGYRSGEG